MVPSSWFFVPGFDVVVEVGGSSLFFVPRSWFFVPAFDGVGEVARVGGVPGGSG